VSWTLFEHTADVGIEARAASLDELFVDAAAGLVDVITDVSLVEPRREAALEVSAAAPDLLLVAWLEELLYRFDVQGELYAAGEAQVTDEGEAWWVRARLRGETFDPARHPLKVQVKAITYHGLEVARDEQGWRARVIFDI
jgi:SHS2 domain-containing protein